MSEKFWAAKRERQEDITKEEQLEAGDRFMDEREGAGSEGERVRSESMSEHEPRDPNLPVGLRGTEHLSRDNEIAPEVVYSWYEKAMRRRDREPLEEERFVQHFFEHNDSYEYFAYGDSERGYLLGVLKHGVFIPTHFAPKSLRGGVELVKDLGESQDIPSVMAITPDLKDTITKIPTWRNHKLGHFVSMFRDEQVPKEIVYNSHPEVKKLMWGLLREYMKGLKD